jgi:hypothetical protein
MARQLKRAGPAASGATRDAFLASWIRDGHQHFRIEENVLLPPSPGDHPPTDDAITRVLTDHVDLRHEERVLFPLVEGALPDDELAALAAAVEEADHGRS